MEEFDVDEVLQQALDRLTLLAEATSALTSTLDLIKGLRRVCRIAVPRLGDWCVVDLLGERDRPERVCVTHRDPAALPVGRLEGELPPLPDRDGGPLARVLRGAGPLLLTEFPSRARARNALSARQLELFEQLGADTAIIAPLRARRRVLGALTVARVTGHAALEEQDLALVEDLAHRIALAVDNARLHQETQRIAERLQRSLLPDLPHHLDLAARYSPSRTTAEVGGDWYDSFPLPNGNTTLIIGDVTGHDLRSAVTMSQLRNMLRGIGCDRQEPPGHILRRLDLAHHNLYGGATASCIYAVLTGPTAGPWALDYSNAGHLPPLLVTHDGDTRYLEEGHGILLGVDPGRHRPHGKEPLPAHSTLLLYTDGLIERRGESLDHGLTRLRQHAAALARESVNVFCDELLSGLAHDSTDDVALLALRLPPGP
ncbi:PP2C family protein-serine/threonine phosphatase [Streptomyces sp. HMX112]|uniref:PP2C family protein-serine/threonine phosphatase n=1 Tax=Streptomyces sp. HMX112 TaxID=3390850 RepID=UPI003A80C4F1